MDSNEQLQNWCVISICSNDAIANATNYWTPSNNNKQQQRKYQMYIKIFGGFQWKHLKIDAWFEFAQTMLSRMHPITEHHQWNHN